LSAECAQKIKDVIGNELTIQDPYYGSGWITEDGEGEGGALYFDVDHNEHMDWVGNEASPEFFDIMEEFKVNGEVHFMDPGQGEPVFWGHRWVDGKYTSLTGEYNIVWTEDE
jgi:hypothetical protein